MTFYDNTTGLFGEYQGDTTQFWQTANRLEMLVNYQEKYDDYEYQYAIDNSFVKLPYYQSDVIYYEDYVWHTLLWLRGYELT